MPRVIGLTGGISTGKSTAAKYLAQQYHLPIFDADIYARQAVAPGMVGHSQIVERYGSGILLADGTIDRAQIGEIVFRQPAEKKWLESIIHPYVRACFANDIQKASSTTVVAVIPLLFEAHLQKTVTEVWVVTCSEEQQLSRLQQRNGLTRDQALARINSQMPLAEKVKLADVVLDNSRSDLELHQQIDKLLNG